MARVSWYGPVFYEASRLEEKYEDYQRALVIAERGLNQVPKYGPLWFIALRLHERRSQQQNQQNQQSSNSRHSQQPPNSGQSNKPQPPPSPALTPRGAALQSVAESPAKLLASGEQKLPPPPPPVSASALAGGELPSGAENGSASGGPISLTTGGSNGTGPTTRWIVHKAMANISNELTWKVYFEWAQIAERSGRFEESRYAFAHSISHCPKNLRWKTWLAGARMELRSAGAGAVAAVSAAENGGGSGSVSSGSGGSGGSGGIGSSDRIRIARLLLNRSLDEVPKKMRATVLLE